VSAVVDPAGVESVAVLRLLAVALAPPTRESLDEIELIADVLAGPGPASPALAELAAAARTTPLADIAAARERLLGSHPLVSPYEASTTQDPFAQARLQADVSGFYAAFGAESHGVAAERPDHAGSELEFLAFLALRRLQASGEGDVEAAARCAAIEEAFLTDHAGRWLGPFFQRLADEARDGFHRALGRVGTRAIAEEVSRRGLDVVEVEAAGGGHAGMDADELRCGDGSPLSLSDRLATPHRPPRLARAPRRYGA
jgi:TorA maturation chaperone TorD